ncbi:hydrogenase iron-sulfur subunit [Candidatus Sumerlaeota bacterium]|nr:hydrogenase iron-sulfur subunit [Candidatus Sumerlaeota bacterium]
MNPQSAIPNAPRRTSPQSPEPLILAFCCHYCAYAAADLAGSMRLQYPANVRLLRLPCTGRVEVNYLLAAFERGADAVIVAGCLEGGCHFQEGNLRARRRVERAKGLLREIGIEPERLEMFNLSSAEGGRFAEIVTEMNERVKHLGLSPMKPDAQSIQAAMREMTHEADERIASEPSGRARGSAHAK